MHLTRPGTYGSFIEGPDEGVTIAILCRRHGRLGLEDGVDSTDCQEPLADTASHLISHLYLERAHLDWQPP